MASSQTVRHYTGVYRRDPGNSRYWLAEVALEPGVHTFGRTLAEAQTRLREALEVWLDVENLTAANIQLDADVEIADLGDELQAVAVDRMLLDQQADQLQARTGLLARRLVLDEHLTYRDAATALGISHQRVAQLINRDDPAPPA